MALSSRLLSLKISSVALLKACPLKYNFQSVCKLSAWRKCVDVNKFHPARHWKHVCSQRGAAHGWMKLKPAFAVGLSAAAPISIYFVLSYADLTSMKDWVEKKVFPLWANARCHKSTTPDVGVAILESQQRETWINSAVKLVQAVRRGVLLFVLCVKLSVLFGPLLVLYPVALLSRRLYSLWLAALFRVVEFSGPVYIKLLQWASTRRDLFSAEFCDRFSLLHHSVRTHDWAETEAALVAAYGKRWHQVLKIDKDQKPLGSGCVAQVYKGYIHTDNFPPETLEAMSDSDELDDIYYRDGVEIHNLRDSFSVSGETFEPGESDQYPANVETPFVDDPEYIAVAVKVLHPQVRERFQRNLTLMAWVAGFLERLVPSLRWINLRECVHEFSLSMMKQRVTPEPQVLFLVPSLHWINLRECVHEFSLSTMKQGMASSLRKATVSYLNFLERLVPSLRWINLRECVHEFFLSMMKQRLVPTLGWINLRECVHEFSLSMMKQRLVPSLRWINLRECVHEFSLSMMKQMDMIHEAKCLKRFHSNFADVTAIRIPVPIMSFLRRNILVESFEEGQSIGEFLKEKEDQPPGLRQRLAEIGVDALLEMVFRQNFVHGDLHPGNILVQNADNFEENDTLVMVDIGDVIVATVRQNPCPLRLVLLDPGITSSLNEEDRAKFNQVFTAVVKGEGEVVADLFLEKSKHVECQDPEAFRKDMADIVNKARQTTLRLSKIKVSVLLSEVFSVLIRHRVKLESNFSTVILAMAILEGLGRSLDPDLDILSKARGVLLGELLRR